MREDLNIEVDFIEELVLMEFDKEEEENEDCDEAYTTLYGYILHVYIKDEDKFQIADVCSTEALLSFYDEEVATKTVDYKGHIYTITNDLKNINIKID